MVCLRDRRKNTTPESVTEVMIEIEVMTGAMIVEMTKGMAGEDTNHHTHTHTHNQTKRALYMMYMRPFLYWRSYGLLIGDELYGKGLFRIGRGNQTRGHNGIRPAGLKFGAGQFAL